MNRKRCDSRWILVALMFLTGGFVSEEETPQLQNLGCESCHGPGSLHADSGDPEDIVGELTAADCEQCHNAERVDNFKFKPLLFGGAH